MSNFIKISTPNNSIRFRKWSRKPYATFMGINKCVTIGSLAATIANRLLPKTNTLEIIVPNGSHLSLQLKSMAEVLSSEASLNK